MVFKRVSLESHIMDVDVVHIGGNSPGSLLLTLPSVGLSWSVAFFQKFPNSVCWVGFYGMSTIVGYLLPNPVYAYILNIYDL